MFDLKTMQPNQGVLMEVLKVLLHQNYAVL